MMMNSKLKFHKHESSKWNVTRTQLKPLQFEFSRIAIISVHGDPGNLTNLTSHIDPINLKCQILFPKLLISERKRQVARLVDTLLIDQLSPT